MTASAKLCKNGFQPSVGLDRRYCRELWHVKGLNFDVATGMKVLPLWSRSNTEEKVFSVLPFTRGTPHPDPSLAGAICVSITLQSGPWKQGDGTSEALVLATFDSDRRWGSAFQESGGSFGKEIEDWGVETFARGFPIPSTSGSGYAWNYIKIPFKRSAILRSFFCDATGISDTDKDQVFAYCGLPFSVFTTAYIYRSPVITKIKTGQTILRYNFESSSPVPPFSATSISGMTIVPTPLLGPLQEYALNRDDSPPTVKVRPSLLYGNTLGDPTQLPFWGRRL